MSLKKRQKKCSTKHTVNVRFCKMCISICMYVYMHLCICVHIRMIVSTVRVKYVSISVYDGDDVGLPCMYNF